jgi:hypothetical protein
MELARILCIQITSAIALASALYLALASALYLASTLDRETVTYLRALHLIKLGPRNMAKPPIQRQYWPN